uniref:WxxW domain-containing protein n=1 Tax=Oncorhynchus mykiss TaxID=8022 RepID=A0A8K9XM76_ONCMY
GTCITATCKENGTIVQIMNPCIDWISKYYPSVGPEGGDFETIENIRKSGIDICSQPKEVECRAKDNIYVPLAELGQNVECNPSVGLICRNKDQGIPPICYNYEIRVRCCVDTVCEWSDWISKYYPSVGPEGGDFETIENIRKSGIDICSSPKDVECRAKDNIHVPLAELGQNVECNPSVGLICRNKDQGIPPICYNYEIRVRCCHCLSYSQHCLS